MKTLQRLAVTVLMAAAAYATPANYGKVANTGVSGVGCIGTVTLTAGCSVMPHNSIMSNDFGAIYQLTTVPPGSSSDTVVLSSGYPAAGTTGIWLGPNATSAWISPKNSNSTQRDPAGNYTYQQSFDMAGVNSSSILQGRFASDNQGTMYLNGVQVAQTASTNASYTTWTPFSITSGFQAGTNTLSWTINNTMSGANTTPSGLRVEFSNVYLPEGNESMALALMVGGTLIWGLKRRKANVLA